MYVVLFSVWRDGNQFACNYKCLSNVNYCVLMVAVE